MGDLEDSANKPQVTGSPRRDRSEILEPFLQKLAALGQHPVQADAPSRIAIGSKSFQIEPWELTVVLEALQPGSAAANGWHFVLAEGIALRAKSLQDIERLEGDEKTPEGRDVCSDLRLDAAIGFALLIELQRAIDEMVVAGDMPGAKRLTQFRHKLSRSISELEEFIGESALEAARSEAAEMLSMPPSEEQDEDKEKRVEKPGDTPAGEPDLQALLELEEELLKQQEMSPAERVASEPLEQVEPEPAPERSQLRILLGVLAVLTAAWLVLVGWPWMNRLEIPDYTLGDFEGIPQITEIVSRPPSLFVKVDAGQWNELGESEQRELIEKVGRKLSATGYSGAHFTETGGRTVGRWLKQTGVELIKSRRSRE